MGRDSTASRIGECLPAAEHSLIAFPDPWVSYLCHWCLRHYITLLYGGLNSRKRGGGGGRERPRFPSIRDSNYPLASVSRRLVLLLCAKLLMYGRNSYRAILRFQRFYECRVVSPLSRKVFTVMREFVSISPRCQMFVVRIRLAGRERERKGVI